MHIALIILIAVCLLGGVFRRFSDHFQHRIRPDKYEPAPGYKPENKPMLDLIDATADTTANGMESLSPKGAKWIGVILFFLIFLIPGLGLLLFLAWLCLMLYLKYNQAGPWKP